MAKQTTERKEKNTSSLILLPLSLNCFPKQPRAPQAHPIPPSHPVSHVTFLVRGGKFAGGLDFSGYLKKAPLIFLQHFLSPPENKQAKSMPP